LFVFGPEVGDFGERGGFEAELEGVGCGQGEEVGDGAEDVVHGGGAEAAAEEFEAGAAEGGGGEGDVGAGGGADVDVANAWGGVGEAFFGDGLEEGFGGAAPEVIEDDVDAGVELVAEGGDEGIGGLVEGDDGVGAEGLELRPAATTREAPRRLAICTASWPEVPVAPRMRTLSPGVNWARSRATQEDMAGLAMAAAVASSSASGRGMSSQEGAGACSAKVP